MNSRFGCKILMLDFKICTTLAVGNADAYLKNGEN